MMQAFSRFARSSPVVGLAWFFLLLALLEWSIREGLILPTIVAKPTDAVATLFTLQQKIDFVGAFFLTFKVTAAAFFSAIAVAVPVGYFLYRRTDFGHAFMGWLSALFAAPVFLLYPLFMVIFRPRRSHAHPDGLHPWRYPDHCSDPAGISRGVVDIIEGRYQLQSDREPGLLEDIGSCGYAQHIYRDFGLA